MTMLPDFPVPEDHTVHTYLRELSYIGARDRYGELTEKVIAQLEHELDLVRIRLHGVHHTDLDFDVTTAIRFHPVEIVLSMGIKLGLVYLFGPPALSVILFEIILNCTAMFSHSNLRLPLWLDGILRLLIVTPDMHRVHHSVIIRERNSNFGFNLSIWDRLLGTYRPQPEKGHEGITIGLANFRDPSRLNLLHLLALPFTHRHP